MLIDFRIKINGYHKNHAKNITYWGQDYLENLSWNPCLLTHFPIVLHICLWTESALDQLMACCLSIGLLGTNCSEIGIAILLFSFKKMHLKLSSAKMVAVFSRGRGVNKNCVYVLIGWWLCCQSVRSQAWNSCAALTWILTWEFLSNTSLLVTHSFSWKQVFVLIKISLTWNLHTLIQGNTFW